MLSGKGIGSISSVNVIHKWDPGKLGSALLCWYSADYITGIASGGEISSWRDLGPNGFNATQASTAAMPSLQYPAGINGFPVVRGDGGDRLTTADIGAQNIGAICVIGGNVANGSAAGGFASIDMGADSDARIMTIFANDVTVYAGDPNEIWNSSFTTFVNSTNNNILAVSDTYQVIINSGYDVFASTGSLNLMASLQNADINGDAAEIIILNSTMDATQRGLLERYARDKYGIAI